LALTIIPEIGENDRQMIFREEEEIISSSTPGSQPRTISTMKPIVSKEDISETDLLKKDQIRFLFVREDTRLHLGFKNPPKPWLPPRMLQKLEKMRKTPLKREEMVNLVEDIAKISVDFYNLKPGTFMAIKFDGCIVESADTQIELLLKIQGKNFGMPVLVWEVGAESFSGWRA